MRDRLIELISHVQCMGSLEGKLADYLLKNGVIVLPCKVGSKVYFTAHENKSVWGGNVVSFSLDAANLWFICRYKCGLNIWHPIEDFGKNVFLTKKEAEKALTERREG